MKKEHMTDKEWFEKHKEQLNEVNKMMENLEKNKKIQKLYNKFIKNERKKIGHNKVSSNLKLNSIKSIFNFDNEIKNTTIPYFKYDRDMDLEKRFG